MLGNGNASKPNSTGQVSFPTESRVTLALRYWLCGESCPRLCALSVLEKFHSWIGLCYLYQDGQIRCEHSRVLNERRQSLKSVDKELINGRTDITGFVNLLQLGRRD